MKLRKIDIQRSRTKVAFPNRAQSKRACFSLHKSPFTLCAVGKSHTFKVFCFLVAVATSSTRFAAPAFAVDHDNIDANRPLDFDDAETIAFREKSIEFGAAVVKPKSGKTGVAGEVEYLYGFKKNWHLNIGVDPSFLAQSEGSRRADFGDISVGVQHNFNRETESSPAFGFRFDANVPTGNESRGLDFRLRGIASRKFGAYGRLHLNLDFDVNAKARSDESSTRSGVILGYSQPLGYPKRFDRTLVAQIGYRGNEMRGESGIANVGIGIRQQVTPSSVFDLGIKSDIAGGANRESLRIIAGYSTAF